MGLGWEAILPQEATCKNFLQVQKEWNGVE